MRGHDGDKGIPTSTGAGWGPRETSKFHRRRRLRLRRLHRQRDGATTLEWALLLAAIALPSYFIIRIALDTLIAHYQLITTLNELPFP